MLDGNAIRSIGRCAAVGGVRHLFQGNWVQFKHPAYGPAPAECWWLDLPDGSRLITAQCTDRPWDLPMPLVAEYRAARVLAAVGELRLFQRGRLASSHVPPGHIDPAPFPISEGSELNVVGFVVVELLRALP